MIKALIRAHWARPFSGIVFWRSPGITLSPITSVGAYTTTLNAGEPT